MSGRIGQGYRGRLAGLLVGLLSVAWAGPARSVELCAAPPAAVGLKASGHLGGVDRKILGLTRWEDIQPLVRNALCDRASVYAYLTDSAEHAYGQCFITAERKREFWGSSHDEGERRLAAMMHDCLAWAGQRYAPVRARIEDNARRHASEEAAAKAKAEAQAQAEARTHAEAVRRKHAEDVQAALDKANAGIAHPLSWDGAQAQAAGEPPSAAMAAQLLALAWQGEGDAAARVQAMRQIVMSLLGAPHVTEVTYRNGQYAVAIQGGGEYAVHVTFVAPSGLETVIRRMRAQVVFAVEDTGLAPRAVVLADDERILSGSAEGTRFAWSSAASTATTLPLTSADASHRYRVRIVCEPYSGDMKLPLRRCLKDDGMVEVWSPAGTQRRDYALAAKDEREIKLDTRAPFAALVRTGNRNTQNKLLLVVEDPANTQQPELRSEQAIGARAQIFVRGAVVP